MTNSNTNQADLLDSQCESDANSMTWDSPVARPADRNAVLHNIALHQRFIAKDLAARMKGDEDNVIPTETVIPLTDADSDLIVHVAIFSAAKPLGGAHAFTVHSTAGFYQSAGAYEHLTERELEVQGLIEMLSELKDTPGRMSIYAAFVGPAEFLNGVTELWWPSNYHRPCGVREEYPGWCHLLNGLFENRRAGITSGNVWTNPALQYCERLAQIYYETGAKMIPDRSAVLDAIEND
jgi:hypothetical protein